MKYLETILKCLKCLTALIHVIFPRKEPVPCPLPDPPLLPLPPPGGDGGDAGRHRSDPVAAQAPRKPNPYEPHPEAADWLGISGYTLMLSGGVGCILRYLL